MFKRGLVIGTRSVLFQVVALSDQACSVLMTANTKRHALASICAKQSKVPAWACEAGIGKVWDDVALKDCAVSFESAQRVAVCPVLEDSATKQEKVSAACSLQSRVSADTCEAGLGKMWEVVTAAECTGEVVALSDQACSVLVNANVKANVVNTICARQSAAPAWACEAYLDKVIEDRFTTQFVEFCFA